MSMLDNDAVENIVREVATATLPRTAVSSVLAEPTADFEGEEALKITIIVPSNAVPSLSGDAALEMLVRVQDRLRQAGEERFPYIEYATEEESQASGDSEL
jgi:hypothetical protein